MSDLSAFTRELLKDKDSLPDRQGILDLLAIITSPIPLAGDVSGVAADANMFATDPESRTIGNVLLSGAGILPFVPALSTAKRGRGILGDIVDSFPETKIPKKPKTIKTKPQKRRSVIIKSEKPINSKSFIRSQDKIPNNINEVVDNFAVNNVAISDNVVKEFPTKDLVPFREWDRKLVDDFTGKLSKKEFNVLKADIAKNGIRNPVTFRLERLKNGNVEAFLTEGNHRLKAAVELGIENIPVRFFFP